MLSLSLVNDTELTRCRNRVEETDAFRGRVELDTKISTVLIFTTEERQ